MKDYQKYIRNFSIIAHIDHGKSTLADRIIEKTGLVSKREMREQFLDNMDLERERGITIKLQTTRLVFDSKDGNEYIFNLIDTPGHVDFTYEVSRSLAACEGAVLVVDATQGVEAQTLANVYLAMDEDLEIMPVLNKIDLPSARPEEIKQEIEDVIGVDAEDAPLVSAKEGIGVEELLERIVTEIPAPQGDENGKLKALIFDSYYDNYKGVVIYTRVFDGTVKEGDIIRLMNTDKKYEVTEVGVYSPGPVECKSLRAGEVGYICASIKKVSDARVGDTITIDSDPTDEALPGYKKVQPMVYCGIYPAEGEKYENVPFLDVIKKQGKILIGITVRKWNFPDSIDPENSRKKYKNELVKFIENTIEKYNAVFIFIPQVIVDYASDVDIAKEIKLELKNKYQSSFIIREDDWTPVQIKNVIGQLDFFVGTRMHSNIFATSMKIPTLAIAYEKKTNGIMKSVGLENYVEEIDEITSESLTKKFENVVNNKQQISYQLRERILKIKEEIDKKIREQIK